jgi:hypothetical protein
MQHVIKIIVSLVFIHIFSSCSNEQICNLGQKEIVDYIVNLNYERNNLGVKEDFSQYDIIIKIENKGFRLFPINYLDTLYNLKDYNQMSYSNFICLLVNERIEPTEEIIKRFPDVYVINPDKDILINLNNLGVEEVFKKYNFSKNSEGYLLTENNEDIDSLIYFFYKKGFLFVFSDFDGKIIFLKPNQVPN